MQARFFLWLVSVCLLCLVNCGEGEKAGVGGDAGASTLEKSFQQVATQYKIPLRILKAVAYLESGVAAQPATAVYGAKNFGPARGETLFGLSAATLGLEGDPSERGVAEQLEAYGAWVNGHFANTGLPATTHNSDEIFNWIWQLAQLHYTGPHTKNVRVIFAKNILSILNEGFTWYNRDEQTIQLAKENPPLQVEKASEANQQLLHVETLYTSKVKSASLVPFGHRENDPPEQTPTGILIQHCPFSFSICLDMQDTDREDFFLGAHYLIPQNDFATGLPLQVNKHNIAVPMLGANGEKIYSNRVVILLTGDSGRMDKGTRTFVRPDWLTQWQLTRLGELVREICADLERNQDLDPTVCRNGALVQHQQQGAPFRWGDVMDYDPLIFASYIQTTEPKGAVTLALAKPTFQAGEWIEVAMIFQQQATYIELEQLIRCRGQQLAWIPVGSEQIRNESRFVMKKRFFNRGPNETGEHFLRVKIYDQHQELMGWDAQPFFLNGFDKETAFAPTNCQGF